MSKYNKWMLVLFILFPIFLFLFGIGNSFTDISKLALSEDDISIDIRHKFYTDKTNQLSLNDVVDKLNDFDELPLNKAKVSFGEIGFWYQIDIKNVLNQSRELIVFLDNPMIDIINVHQLKEGEYKLVRSLGDSNLDNIILDIALPNFNVELDAGQQTSFLIYTTTTGAANVPISIYDSENFYRYKDAVYLLWGAFIGIVAVMSVYNLILFIGTREKLYVLYIGYIAIFLIELATVHGYGVYIMSLPLFDFFSKNIISMNYLLGYFTLMFASHYLKFNEEPERKVTRYVNYLSYSYLVLSVISIFVVEYIAAQIFFSLQILLYGLAVTMMYTRLKEGVKWANFYIFSWLPLLVGTAVGPLLLTGNLEYSFWSRHALLLGVVFEITFMAMALAHRLRTSENDRLYQASHDHLFGFANSNSLEVAVKGLTEKSNEPSFSIMIVSISKYESIVPYLPKESLKSIVYQFVSDVETELSNELLLIDIDKDSQYMKMAMIREGVFAFLVSSNDEHLLNNVMSQFAAQQPITYNSGELSLNIKCLIGASTYTSRINNTNELVNKAQQAIELAIENGNLHGIYNDHVNNNDQRKVMLASDLQTAIEAGSLQLYHQPQTSTSTGMVVGSEVLLRWSHPNYGFIPPDEFVRIAEDTGIINKLSEWVFNKSCEHLVELMKLGIDNHIVSVNMSVHDVMHNGFISYLIRTIERYQLRADMFVLELTETVSVTDTKKFTRNMLELKDIGFCLAIDDFGTGYSSLTYVSKHPFDKLKIDREFIKNLDQSDKDFTIVSATIKMAKSLGLEVVAEGVEDQKTLTLLKSLNCEWAQGYHISKPLPFEAYVERLDEESIKNSFS